MVAPAARWTLRVLIVVALLLVLFYMGRPLYWKLSATVQDIWMKNYDPQSVKQGITELVDETQKGD